MRQKNLMASTTFVTKAELSALEDVLMAQKAKIANLEALSTKTIDTGDTAFILVCSSLVLMMTIPGLALFYGAFCRRGCSCRCAA